MVVLEDLHWADDESLELLAGLVGQLGATAPCSSWPPPDCLCRGGGGGRPLVQLENLDDEASAELVDEVLQHPAVVARELSDLIVERADGNPFFVEELLKMLIEDGVIEPG